MRIEAFRAAEVRVVGEGNVHAAGHLKSGISQNWKSRETEPGKSETTQQLPSELPFSKLKIELW